MTSELYRSAAMFCIAWGLLVAGPVTLVRAEDKPTDKPADTIKAEGNPTAASATTSVAGTATTVAKPKFPPYAEVLKDFKLYEGLIKLHRKENKLYAELDASQLNRDFVVLTAIARGIGEGPLLAGMTWGFGDDWLWQFRRVDDNIHVVRRNVRFRAAKGSPEEKAVRLAYTDSVLFAVPILTTSGSGGVVIDLAQIFMNDLPQIGNMLPGFSFAANKSTWAPVKGFRDNVELEVAAVYASSGHMEFDTVPDSRGISINIHYSISQLPETGYQPRMADDRVGYFLTAVKDFSLKGDTDRFVRYINRWDLQKADPTAEVSPPKKPVVFWLERTVPFQYRAAIREGVEEWNKAFEKAGFSNAIEVRQQSDSADWDPEDVNYNTFRWITAGAGFAMGPSRVNPMTGQILDADIIFDSDFVQFWKREYETFTPATIAGMTGGPLDIAEFEAKLKQVPSQLRHNFMCRCELHNGMSRELALGATVAMAKSAGPVSTKDLDKLILQGLKEVTMHEVGHTLGLRHNFKASTMLTLAEMNDLAKTRETGMVASVMDYSPVNLMPKGQPQGNYYTHTLGPYDMWAIEYGYKPFTGGTDAEVAELKKIAARSGEANLAYGTDEDTTGVSPDPYSNRFDLGRDPMEYSKSRTQLVDELWPALVDKVTKEGDGYQRARQAFGVLIGQYGQSVFFSARFVGGLTVNRNHKGDPNAKAPLEVVPAAQQREALSLLEAKVFSDKPFNFPPELYNQLAASHWSHWGTSTSTRADYPVHQIIAMWQQRVLDQLLSSLTLERLYDSELKVAKDKDALTTAELLSRLTKSIFAIDLKKEGKYTEREPGVSSLRRNLQRIYLKRLSTIALGQTSAPEDCQSLAYLELKSLETGLRTLLKANDDRLDNYTRAHLQESCDRIQKVLDARLTFTRP